MSKFDQFKNIIWKQFPICVSLSEHARLCTTMQIQGVARLSDLRPGAEAVARYARVTFLFHCQQASTDFVA